MAAIGPDTFTRSANGYPGLKWIKAFMLTVETMMLGPANIAGGNDREPVFRIFAGATEVDAVWEQTSDKGNDSLSITRGDPSFPAPIYASLVEVEGEDLALIWSRRRAAE